MELTRGGIPLYYQIAQIFRSQIHSQEYKPNDMLPTEEEMVRTLGVRNVLRSWCATSRFSPIVTAC